MPLSSTPVNPNKPAFQNASKLCAERADPHVPGEGRAARVSKNGAADPLPSASAGANG